MAAATAKTTKSSVKKTEIKKPVKKTSKKSTAKKPVVAKKTTKKNQVQIKQETSTAVAIIPFEGVIDRTPLRIVRLETVPEDTENIINIDATGNEIENDSKTEIEEKGIEKKKIKKKLFVKIHHEVGPSRGDKQQLRLKGNSTGKNQWNHKLHSQAAKIDDLLSIGQFTIEEIQEMSAAGTKGRIYNHVSALKKKGYDVININGILKFG